MTDRELIEAMAQAIINTMVGHHMPLRPESNFYTCARAALDVVREAEGWPAEAVRKLRAEPEIGRRLAVFVDYWGLDAYTPPPDVERNVRDIVSAFLAKVHPAPPEDTA